MRMVVRVLAILLIVGGIVWILQGISVLPGSFMSGKTSGPTAAPSRLLPGWWSS